MTEHAGGDRGDERLHRHWRWVALAWVVMVAAVLAHQVGFWRGANIDSDVLAPESHEFLDLIAEVVESHAGIDAVRIEGHTDRLGTPEHNQELSERRAQVVADYLRSNEGMGKVVLQMDAA